MVKIKEIGVRVRQLRKKAGETQDDLAAVVGVSRSTIAGIEGGLDQGGLETMVAIGDHYHVPMDWLLCREVPPGAPPVGKLIYRSDQLALFDFWEGLTPAERMTGIRMWRIPYPGEVA